MPGRHDIPPAAALAVARRIAVLYPAAAVVLGGSAVAITKNAVGGQCAVPQRPDLRDTGRPS